MVQFYSLFLYSILNHKEHNIFITNLTISSEEGVYSLLKKTLDPILRNIA